MPYFRCLAMSRSKFPILKLSGVLLSLGSLLFSCNNGKQYTYGGDIAPIIDKNCVPCHRPGGGAPFSLQSYADVRKKAKTIVSVTKSGYMPPWPADKHYSRFLNERGLSG